MQKLVTAWKQTHWTAWVEHAPVPREFPALLAVAREMRTTETFRVLRLAMMIASHCRPVFSYINDFSKSYATSAYRRWFLDWQASVQNLPTALEARNPKEWKTVVQDVIEPFITLFEVLQDCIHNAFVQASHGVFEEWAKMREIPQQVQFVDRCMMELAFQWSDTDRLAAGSLREADEHTYLMAENFVKRCKDTPQFSAHHADWMLQTMSVESKVANTWFAHVMPHFLSRLSAWYGDFFAELNREATTWSMPAIRQPQELNKKIDELDTFSLSGRPNLQRERDGITKIAKTVITKTASMQGKGIENHNDAGRIMSQILNNAPLDYDAVDRIIQDRTGFQNEPHLIAVSAIVQHLVDMEMAKVLLSETPTRVGDWIDADGTLHKGDPPQEGDWAENDQGVWEAVPREEIETLEDLVNKSTEGMNVMEEDEPLTPDQQAQIDLDDAILEQNIKSKMVERLGSILFQYRTQLRLFASYVSNAPESVLQIQEKAKEVPLDEQNWALMRDADPAMADMIKNIQTNEIFVATRVSEAVEQRRKDLKLEWYKTRIARFEQALKLRQTTVSLKKLFIALMLFILIGSIGALFVSGNANAVFSVPKEAYESVVTAAEQPVNAATWEIARTSSGEGMLRVGETALVPSRILSFTLGKWEAVRDMTKSVFWPDQVAEWTSENLTETSALGSVAYGVYRYFNAAKETTLQTIRVPEWNQVYNLRNWVQGNSVYNPVTVYPFLLLMAASDAAAYGLPAWILFQAIHLIVSNRIDIRMHEDRRLVDGAALQTVNFVRRNAQLFPYIAAGWMLANPAIRLLQFLNIAFLASAAVGAGTVIGLGTGTIASVYGTSRVVRWFSNRLTPDELLEREFVEEDLRNTAKEARQLLTAGPSFLLGESKIKQLMGPQTQQQMEMEQIRAQRETARIMPKLYNVSVTEEQTEKLITFFGVSGTPVSTKERQEAVLSLENKPLVLSDAEEDEDELLELLRQENERAKTGEGALNDSVDATQL